MTKEKNIIYITVSENGYSIAKKFYSDEIKLISRHGDKHAVIVLKSNDMEYHCREDHEEVLRQIEGKMKTI